MCGEKSDVVNGDQPITGSPPRVRGKEMKMFALKENIRITPACAGKSRESVNQTRIHQDHPRVCGEK